MAIVFPRTDVMSALGVVTQTFTLMARSELSRMANGVTIPKRMGSSIWIAEWTTKDKKHDDAIDFEAIVNSLEDGINSFQGRDMRRRYPKAYPTGAFVDSGTILSINADNKRIRLTTLPAFFQITRGDYFCFDYPGGTALHQVMETNQAGIGGTTVNEFEVRPHIRPGAVVGTPVTFKDPYAIFKQFPGQTSFSTANILQSNASLKAYQYLE